jgi:hypothetical protein
MIVGKSSDFVEQRQGQRMGVALAPTQSDDELGVCLRRSMNSSIGGDVCSQKILAAASIV